ncbi:MAG: response regulator, partial [Bacteroidota bacterium]
LNQLKKLKILIAEDDDISAFLIEKSIKIFSREILKASSGYNAVELCKTNPDIDLILMDIKMPNINGFEATALIRQFNKDVIIIAQTAFALFGDEERAIAVGCNDYIAKPIDMNLLMAKIKKHFKQ